MDLRQSVREPDFDADVNVLRTVRLLQSCIERGVKKIVFTSTGEALYREQKEFAAPEEHPQYPLSPYGVLKLSAERYLHFYSLHHGISCVALRYSNVPGPRQDPQGEAGVVAIFCGNLAAHRPLRINGSGEQTRDYVSVGDIARANVLALENGAPNGALQHWDGHRDQRKRTIGRMCRLSGRGLPARHGPQKPGEQARSSVDPSEATRFLNWHLEVDLNKGLKETLGFFGVI